MPKSKQKIELIRFRTDDASLFDKARIIRTEVFVIEQKVENNLEFDGLDIDCIHYLAVVDDNPAGTARWRETQIGCKLERFAVLKEYRGIGVGDALLDSVLKEAKPLSRTIYLNAQDVAVRFYEKNNFKIIGDSFIEANIVHYKMIYKG
jgi:predicted GNAT family N-acyltransferase